MSYAKIIWCASKQKYANLYATHEPTGSNYMTRITIQGWYQEWGRMMMAMTPQPDYIYWAGNWANQLKTNGFMEYPVLDVFRAIYNDFSEYFGTQFCYAGSNSEE